MNKLLFYIIFFNITFNISAVAQQKKVDSLKNVLQKYEQDNVRKKYTIQDSVKVNILIKISSAYDYLDPEESIKFVNEALDISNKIGYVRGQANSKFNIGRVNSNKGNLEKSIAITYEALEIFEKLEDELRIADCYNNIGVYYARSGNLAAASSAMFKALKIYEKLDLPLIVINGYANIGTIYKSLDELEKAQFYYDKALSIAKGDLEFNYEFSGIYLNSGRVHENLKNYDKAEEQFFKALKCLSKRENKYVLATIYSSIGGLYLSTNKLETAFEYYQKSHKIFEEIKNPEGLFSSYIDVGYCYLKLGNLKEAKKNLEIGLEGSEKNNLLTNKIRGNYWLIELHEKQKKYELAYKHQVQYKILKDIQYNTDNENQIVQLQMQYDFDKMQEANILKQNHNEIILNEKARKEKIFKYAIMIAFGILCVFVILLFVNLIKNIQQKKIIQKQNELLKIQNDNIRISLIQKDNLLKEIHHRVKNNLQIISSLLNIQSSAITDEETLKVIKMGQSRVQAMSLVHETLFQSEQFNAIDMNIYFQKLINVLKQLYFKNKEEYLIEVDAKNIYLDINIAIPLGLIVNELATNSFKYAYKDNIDAQLKIQLVSISENNYELIVTDNGLALQEEIDFDVQKSFGLKLVRILAKQIKGSMTINRYNNLSFKISFYI